MFSDPVEKPDRPRPEDEPLDILAYLRDVEPTDVLPERPAWTNVCIAKALLRRIEALEIEMRVNK